MIKNLRANFTNMLGKITPDKIIVFESDDWGTVRMASTDAFRYFLKLGYPVDECPYNTNDCLESNADLEALFNVLRSFHDTHGRHPCFTAYHISANPDFERIKNADFENYYFEPFDETAKRYPNSDKIMEYYRYGIATRIFRPQFHGREHVNVHRWLKALQSNDAHAHAAFSLNMFSVHHQRNPRYRMEYMDAFDVDDIEQLRKVNALLGDGLKMFNQTWGYASETVMVPCYIWHSDSEQTMQKLGIKFIQGNFYHQEPILGESFRYRTKYHYTGQRSRSGQRFIVRNAFFEPALDPDYNWVDKVLKEIQLAFRWKKPAVIQTHRLNFIGSLAPLNRDRNLAMLEILLRRILQEWPDVMFLSSDELGNQIFD